MKLISFSIFDINNNECSKMAVSEKDNDNRRIILYEIIKNSGAEIICLQDASTKFYEKLKEWNTPIDNNYHIIKNNNLIILALKKMFDVVYEIDIGDKYASKISNEWIFKKLNKEQILKLVKQNNMDDEDIILLTDDDKEKITHKLKIDCLKNLLVVQILNIILINIVYPIARQKPAESIMMNEIISRIVEDNGNKNIIVTGNMNTIFPILNNNKIKSIIPVSIRRKYATSISFEDCEKIYHNFTDDFYKSSGIEVSDLKIAANYDDNHQLIFTNGDNYNFKEMASPFCKNSVMLSKKECYVYDDDLKFTHVYEEGMADNKIKAWPSNHALLMIKIEKF